MPTRQRKAFAASPASAASAASATGSQDAAKMLQPVVTWSMNTHGAKLSTAARDGKCQFTTAVDALHIDGVKGAVQSKQHFCGKQAVQATSASFRLER